MQILNRAAATVYSRYTLTIDCQVIYASLNTGCSSMSTVDTERALKIVERLIKATPSGSINRSAMVLQKRLNRQLNAVPMSEIIGKMPGKSLADKARTLGVTRQTIHAWVNGAWRPDMEMAKKLEKLTGFSVVAIRGREYDPA